jgi:hypothetical protein
MTVKNMTFLVNKLGEDCSPLQFVRELTQNSVDALRGSHGQVIWDVDWALYRLTGVRKLACIDTGEGMTGEEMVGFINELSSSARVQSATANFGVGAKIAAAPRNPQGMVYKSWKNGVGHMIHLWLDPDSQTYGLKRWPGNGGEFWTPINDKAKPKEIDGHGTMVTLLGTSEDEETIWPPAGTPSKSRWVLRYLNTRYFRFPKNIQVKAREGFELPQGNKHNFLRTVDGQGTWLDRNCEASGMQPLVGATAHWWILRQSSDRDSGHFAPGGHVAALYQNELYELVAGRGGLSRLQTFGVIFGTDRVVIYIEPASTLSRQVTANTARTHLLVGGESLDWSDWAAEFRENMPESLRNLQDEISAQATQTDHRKAIQERLKQIQDLLRFEQYVPKPAGKQNIQPEDPIPGGESDILGSSKVDDAPAGKKGGRSGEVYAMFTENGSVAAEAVRTITEPETRWVSQEDGTRAHRDMEDRAGKYLRDQNLLMINSDFRVFTDMVDRWVAAYANVPGAAHVVKETVHEWFEQQLIEAVMSAHALKQTGNWSITELQELWDESALTATVLPRWHIDQTIRRTLRARLGVTVG